MEGFEITDSVMLIGFGIALTLIFGTNICMLIQVAPVIHCLSPLEQTRHYI